MPIYEQQLKQWSLNQQFTTIKNCKIILPTWRREDSYSTEFFLAKRDGLTLDEDVGWIVTDHIIINDIEFILVQNWDKVQMKYKSNAWYVNIWIERDISPHTPTKIVKWLSAAWELKLDDIAIWDAFYQIHNKWAYNNSTVYQANDIVQQWWTDYINLVGSIGKTPPDLNYWQVYDNTETRPAIWDPAALTYGDVYKGSRMVLMLIKNNIAFEVSVWQYLYFHDNKSNLQWTITEIDYIEILDNDNILVYIKSTNSKGTAPYFNSNTALTEKVSVYDKYWEAPVIADEDWLWVYNILFNNSWITWVKEIKILDDKWIKYIAHFNDTLFALSDDKLYYSNLSRGGYSDVNFYPLDYIQVRGGIRLIPYGKLMVLIWTYDKVVTPINDIQNENVGYVITDLNFEEELFYKESALVYMWSLYMVKKNRELVMVNIVSVNNIDYQVEEESVMVDVRWLLDDLYWSVYMCLDDKNLHVINIRWWNTYDYIYNLEYWFWAMNEYAQEFRFIKNWVYYWDGIYIIDEESEEEIEQSITWVVWHETLHTLETMLYTKIIFGLPEKKLDYYLDLEYEIWGRLFVERVDLKNYPIDEMYNLDPFWLWDSLIGASILWLSLWVIEEKRWTFVSVNIWIWRTCGLMRFTIRNKPEKNWFIYGWSIVESNPLIPPVTEFNFQH